MRPLSPAALALALLAGCPERHIDLGDRPDGGPGADAASYPQRELIYQAPGPLERPWAIALDSRNAYITGASSQGRVLQIPLDGRPIIEISPAPSPALSIAVDEHDIYWVEIDAVRKAPIGGGPITTLATAVLSAGYNMLALDDTHVYYTTYLDTVESVPKAGGPVTVLATDQEGASGISTDGSNVWWANFAADGSIMTLPTSGGTPAIFQAVAFPRNGLAVWESNVYYMSEGLGADTMPYVARAPMAGGPPTMLATWSRAGRATNIAVDGTHVYFWQPDCEIGKAALDGGQVEVRSYPGLGCPHFYAVDEAHLYFTSDQGLARVPK